MTDTVQALVINPGPRTESGIRTLTTDLHTLQGLVGGYIEATHGYRNSDGHDEDAPRITFYLNEEGKIHSLPETDSPRRSGGTTTATPSDVTTSQAP